MSEIEENMVIIRDLIYKDYNKRKFEKYTSKIENLIILEFFLRKANFLM